MVLPTLFEPELGLEPELEFELVPAPVVLLLVPLAFVPVLAVLPLVIFEGPPPHPSDMRQAGDVRATKMDKQIFTEYPQGVNF